MTRLRLRWAVAILTVGFILGSAAPADARVKNFQFAGKHELSGGIGFGAGFTDFSPGGFKWFNDYGYTKDRAGKIKLPAA